MTPIDDACVADVLYRPGCGTVRVTVRLGWKPEHHGKWAHGEEFAHLGGRSPEEALDAALARAARDAAEKHGAAITVTNRHHALNALERAVEASSKYGLREARAQCLEPWFGGR